MRCAICDREGTPEGIHLHEVRSHKKPQRTLEGRNVPSPWDASSIGLQSKITVSVGEWRALWETVDRLRQETKSR